MELLRSVDDKEQLQPFLSGAELYDGPEFRNHDVATDDGDNTKRKL